MKIDNLFLPEGNTFSAADMPGMINKAKLSEDTKSALRDFKNGSPLNQQALDNVNAQLPTPKP